MFEISFSKNLKKFREDNNLSQKELADMLQVSRATIIAYEKGSSEPTLYVLFRAAKIMNCSLDELLGINIPSNKLNIYNKIENPSNIKLEQALNKNLNILNNLIKKYRRSFEDLTLSKKRTDRMLDELTMSKKRNDRTYEELKRTINRVSKYEDELMAIINSLSIDSNSEDISTENTNIIDTEYINYDSEEELEEDEIVEIKYIPIPVFSGIACGKPLDLEDENPSFKDIPLVHPLNPDKLDSYFIVTAHGESMNEICQDEEKIILMSPQKAHYEAISGDIVAVSIDNAVTLKELVISYSTDEVILRPHSTNPEFQDIIYSFEKFKNVNILGVFICTLNELYNTSDELEN